AGLAQARREVDQTRRHDEPARIEAAVGSKLARRGARGDDAARGDGQVAGFVASRGGVQQPSVADEDVHASFPEMMDITAMRTAMPKVTCGRMTLWRPSATEESISTPRLIGPGCMTMASGLASANFCGVR